MLACPLAGPIPTAPVQTPLFIQSGSAAEMDVRMAFRYALDGDTTSACAEVRAATLAFAAIARAEGRSSDAALIGLKRAIAHEGWWPSLIEHRLGTPARQLLEFRLYVRLFPWFLEGYFGSPVG